MFSKLILAALLVLCPLSQSAPGPKMTPKKCAAEVRAQLLESPDAIRRELLFNTDLITYTVPKTTPLQFWVMTTILSREEQVTNAGVIGLGFEYGGFRIEHERLLAAIERMERGGKLLERTEHPNIYGVAYRVSVLGEWERQGCMEFYKRLYETAKKQRHGNHSLQDKVEKLNQPRSIIPRFGHTQAVLLSYLNTKDWLTAKEVWTATEEYNTPTDLSSLYATLAELKRLNFVVSADVVVGENKTGGEKVLKAYRTTQAGEDALARSFFFYTVLGEVDAE